MELHNVSAEESAIGAVLINPDSYYQVADQLSMEDFWIERYGWAWDAFRKLHEKNMAIDFVTVGNQLNSHFKEFGGQSELTRLVSLSGTSLNIGDHISVIKSCSIRRHLENAANEIVNVAHHGDDDTLINDAVGIFEKAVSRSERKEMSEVSDVVSSLYDTIAENSRKDDDELANLPTSLQDINKYLIGWQKQDLIIVAARPGQGKSSFLMQEVKNVGIDQRKNVAVFSAEMSNEQLTLRLVSQMTGIDSQRLKHGRLRDDEWPKVTYAIEVVENSRIFLDDTPSVTPLQMRTKCKRLKMLYGIDLIVMDYLQLMSAGGKREDNRVQEVSYISRQLKVLAREMDCPVLTAAQLSRAVEQRSNKRPQLSDLRESGSLEQDADIVIFLHEPQDEESQPGLREIIIAKHRNGPTGSAEAFWKPNTTTFESAVRMNVDFSA
jgi:replicative DNA helicase